MVLSDGCRRTQACLRGAHSAGVGPTVDQHAREVTSSPASTVQRLHGAALGRAAVWIRAASAAEVLALGAAQHPAQGLHHVSPGAARVDEDHRVQRRHVDPGGQTAAVGHHPHLRLARLPGAGQPGERGGADVGGLIAGDRLRGQVDVQFRWRPLVVDLQQARERPGPGRAGGR